MRGQIFSVMVLVPFVLFCFWCSSRVVTRMCGIGKKKSPCSSLEHYLHSFPCSSATSVSIPCVCARCTHPVCVPRVTQTGTCGCRLGPALFLGFPSAFLARNSRTEGTLPSFESVRRGESSQAWEIFLSPLHVACFYALTCPSSLAGSR